MYFLVTVAFTIYIICNWNKATSFTFFSDFNGINLVFVVWIILLLMPIIGSFEGFGFKMASLFFEQKEQKVRQKDDEFEAEKKIVEQRELANERYEATKKEKSRIILSSDEHRRESDV